MATVQMMHNPYLIHTELMIDGNPVIAGPLIELVHNSRLQVWIEKFFPLLFEICNTNTIELTFHGTTADFADIELIAAQQMHRENINLKVVHAAGGEADPSNKITELKKLFDEAKQGPIAEFHNQEIDDEFNKALDPNFEVSVIATMSAGKSTLINAFLGEDLLPSRNEACTATVTYITDYDEMDHFEGRAIDEDGKNLTDWIHVNAEKLSEWNCEDITCVKLRGNIPMFAAEKNVRLVLVDTPGPNNSRNMNHHRCTIGMIQNKQKPMVLYVINATQFGVHDDQRLLTIVKDEMSKGGKQSHDRFIFAVNRIDDFDPERESVSGVLENVRQYLEENGIHNPNIYPVSARLAKLVRERRKGYELTRSEKNDLNKYIDQFTNVEDMQMLQYSSASPTVKRSINSRIAQAERVGDTEEIAVLHSGIPVIEEAIQEYLKKYAQPAKLYLAKSSFACILERHETIDRIEKDLRNKQSEREMLHTQMNLVQQRMQKGNEAKAFNDRVKALTWKRSEQYEARIRPIELAFSEKANKQVVNLKNETVSPRVAETLGDSIRRDAEYAVVILQQELEKTVQQEVYAMMEQLRADYQRYVEELLGDLGEMSVNLKAFRAAALTMPSTQQLVEKHKETKRIVVGYDYISKSKWWNPFSWGKQERVDRTETQTNVPMIGIVTDITNHMRKYMFDIMKQAEQQTADEVVVIRDDFLKNMEKLEGEIRKMVDDMAAKTASAEALERAIQDNAATRSWLDDFQRQLDDVLSIDTSVLSEVR